MSERPTAETGRQPGPTPGARPSRVAEEIREVLATELPRLKDPRIGFVTITGAKASPDLRHAWVFYTTMGTDAERRGTSAGLRSATAHLRSVVGREVRLKFLPELHFEEDATMERSERIEELLRELHEREGR
jgi:ribosome-binding factor A